MQKTATTPPPSFTLVAPATPQASAAQPAPMVFRDPGTGDAYTVTAPRTARDMQALKARREELSNQLQSVDSRRSKLMSQLRSTDDPVAVKGLESRLALLDARQLQLESDLQQTGQQLSSGAAGLVASTSDAPRFAGFSQNQVMALSVLSIIFIFFPIAAGISKALFRRSNKPAVPPQALTETAQRLERLESSVDAIAIEVERISEGQRFVTKLLAEGQAAPALGAGAAQPVRVGK
ncbi:MAG TPA: hypothetical protein VJ865_09125, partial [Gemmatimonadaceae bacterium]|nr:hypothetical protein [Gemmatimonadaceae bacterium]